MGKNRRAADVLFEKLEQELEGVLLRRSKITNKVRAQIIEMAKKKGISVKEMIDEVRPALIKTAENAKVLSPPNLQ